MSAGRFRSFVLSMALVGSLLFLWSCGGSENSGPLTYSGGGPADFTAPESNAKSFVSIGLAVETEQGMQFLPDDPEQAREFLRQTKPQKTSNRIVTDPSSTSQLYQLVGSDLCQLQGAGQPYQAYTPESLLISMFGGVTPRGFSSPVLPHGVVVWNWTLPLPQPVFLFEQRQDNGGIGGQFDENNVLTSNVLTYTVDYRWRQETVNGVTRDYYKVTSSVGDIVLFDSGDEEIVTVPGIFPLTPVFRSAYSGEYTLAASQNGTPIRSETYRQKGIQFGAPFPTIEVTTGDPPEAIPITNNFHWDDFSSQVDPVWRAFVEVSGVGTVQKFGDTGLKPGSIISFVWNPADLLLTAARGVQVRALQLKPRAQCPTGCCGENEALTTYQAREAQDAPVYPYTVEASDSAYAGTRYRTIRGGILPGQRLLLVLDPRVTPEEFEPDVIPENSEEPMKLTFSARLAAIGFNTAPSFDWELHVRNRASGQILRTFLPSESRGASIRSPIIEWDGKVNGVALDPDDYKFDLVATACESGGSDGGGSDVVDAKISMRPGDPGPCLLETAEALFKVEPGLKVVKVRFGGDSSLTSNATTGPHLVYDYVGNKARGKLPPADEPHWSKAAATAYPALFTTGSEIFVSPDLEGRGSVPQDIQVSVRASLLDGDGTTTPFILTFVPVGTDTLHVTDWEANDIGRVIFKATLPHGVGRYRLTLDWTLQSSGAPALSRTPKDSTGRTAHMLYTVLRDFAAGQDLNDMVVGGSVSAPNPDLEHAWYHPDSFEHVVLSLNPSRSPLDMATTWARGETDKSGILRSLTDRFYEHSGYLYNPGLSTTTVDPGLIDQSPTAVETFQLDKALEGRELDCSGVACLMRVLARTCGARCATVRLQRPGWHNPGDNQVTFFTRYLRPLGGGRGGGDTGNEFLHRQRVWIYGQEHSVGALTLEHPFLQFSFQLHEFLRDDDQAVYDAVSRFDSNPGRATDDNINGFPIANLHNVDNQTLRGPFAANQIPTNSDYKEAFGAVADETLGLPFAAYRQRLIYTPTLRPGQPGYHKAFATGGLTDVRDVRIVLLRILEVR
ncbi:MAG: hypothetical protein CMLOHMNK_03333 [Steroidobacteraceae bacterium]|nr:hypothetical protein [Steroidobacteraceae bacterium]